MTVYRLIAPDWLTEENPNIKKVLEGEFTDEELVRRNAMGYNIYFLPNSPSVIDSTRPVDGRDIDTFRFVFVDYDLKSNIYSDKQEFIDTIKSYSLAPSFIVDSGNGVHVYYSVSDLDAMSYLRLQRRLCRLFKTDEAVGKIYQLMRVPGTVNTKHKDAFKTCDILETSDKSYTCEELDKVLPPISLEDERFCQQHYDKTYRIENNNLHIDDKLPVKFGALLKDNQEAKKIWIGGLDDRSKGDFRLAHIMFASGFTRDEAMSVLVNSSKALSRSPVHRISYAENIVTNIWTYEQKDPELLLSLSSSVEELLSVSTKTIDIGKRFPCNEIVDGTKSGFRLTQVLGLVGGSGVGKTTFALNLFRWFVESNPEYDHFFVSLEQPVQEIAHRWARMCLNNIALHKKVQVLGNYNRDGTYRDLSLEEIKNHILQHEKKSGRKVGCVVLDHIGILKRNNKNGETQGLAEVSKSLKSFANETNTFFVVQSQTNRLKSGIGDIELDKDAAYGTTAFEWYVDMLITIWAPLKRIYDRAPNMTVTAFKYCKIRDKNVKYDRIQEDQRYLLMYDVDTERYRRLTQDEEKSFVFFNNQATALRKQDKKTDVSEYKSVPMELSNVQEKSK